MVRLWLLVLACLLLGGCSEKRSVSSNVPPLPVQDVIDSVRSSIVQVLVRVQNPSAHLPVPPPCQFVNGVCVVGTGFFVNRSGDVVTAFHVVSEATRVIAALQKGMIPADMEIAIAMPNVDLPQGGGVISGNFFQISMKLKASRTERDIAVLSTTGRNPFDGFPRIFDGALARNVPKATVAVAKIETNRPRDGDEVLAVGFPLGSQALESTTGRIASSWINENLTTAKANGSSVESDVYHLDLRINPGNSGGPLFHTRTQGVLGIVVEFISSQSRDYIVRGAGLAVVVPSKYITELLTANQIAWTDVSAPAPAGKSK